MESVTVAHRPRECPEPELAPETSAGGVILITRHYYSYLVSDQVINIGLRAREPCLTLLGRCGFARPGIRLRRRRVRRRRDADGVTLTRHGPGNTAYTGRCDVFMCIEILFFGFSVFSCGYTEARGSFITGSAHVSHWGYRAATQGLI